MTKSTKAKTIISLLSLACMSGWASAASINQSLTMNNKTEASQNVNSSNNELKSKSSMSNQFQAEGSATTDGNTSVESSAQSDGYSQAEFGEVADAGSETETDDTPLILAEDTDEVKAPQSEVEQEETIEEMSEFADVTSELSTALDSNVSLVTQTLNQAEASNSLNSVVKQGLETVVAADAVAQATQAAEQVVNLAVQDTVSATTQTLVQENVNGQVAALVSEQISSAVEAETAIEIAQTIAANIGL